MVVDVNFSLVSCKHRRLGCIWIILNRIRIFVQIPKEVRCTVWMQEIKGCAIRQTRQTKQLPKMPLPRLLMV